MRSLFLRTALALVAGVGLGCFSEEPSLCPKGEKGCRCLEDTCEAGLMCSQEYCVLENCTVGDAYCNCDDGTCLGAVECFDGAVCLPPEGSDDAAGSGGESGGGAGSGDDDSTPSTGDPTPGDSTGSASCALGEPCGTCRRCDDSGTCVVDVGMACDGPTLACGDYVWGLMDGSCLAMAAVEIGARCDAFGECSTASSQDCPADPGEALVVCHSGCVDAPGVCVPGAAAATVSLDAMCVSSGPGPDCRPACFNGTGSEYNHNECSGGDCVNIPALDVDCGAYKCDDQGCLTSCTSELDCAQLHACDMMTGECYLP